MISEQKIQALREALRWALENGAGQCRLSLSESITDTVDTLNGEVDKVSHCYDSDIQISIFVEGRYGEFSTNSLSGIRDFILKAISMTRMMTPDPCRKLPDPSICCKNALTGDELRKCDPAYAGITPAQRIQTALDACIWGKVTPDGAQLISEEGQYADNETDGILLDSNGLECRERQTSFSWSAEVTVLSPDGARYSAYWWDSSAFKKDVSMSLVGQEAVRRACAQIGAEPLCSGKYNMVVDQSVASKLVNPVLEALQGYYIQQNNSFLRQDLGKKVFGDSFTLRDDCHRTGERGSCLFDSEGVATSPDVVVEKGVLQKFFLSTFFAGKLGMKATQEECQRPHLLPYPCEQSQQDLLRKMGTGILVTGFNGGNSNSATGDFSYGIEGHYFENGKIVRPVDGMLITGNFKELFCNLVLCASDVRWNMTNLIPSLAFKDVDFSG